MPTSITHSAKGTTNLVYDGVGSRVKKTSGASTTYYIGAHYERCPPIPGATNYGAGSNVLDTVSGGGTAYEILNGQGELIGLYAEKGAFSLAKLPSIGINHISVVVKDASGAFSKSMSGLGGYNLYGVTSVCHQMASQALLKAGYALTVNGASGGWSSFLTGAVYGPYGTAAPALSYFQWENQK